MSLGPAVPWGSKHSAPRHPWALPRPENFSTWQKQPVSIENTMKHHTLILPGSKSVVGSPKFSHTWLYTQTEWVRDVYRNSVARILPNDILTSHLILKSFAAMPASSPTFFCTRRPPQKTPTLKEKKKKWTEQKKNRAPRWATFRWGLALKPSRTTENEASLNRCPCCQRDGSFKIRIEFWCTKKDISWYF